MRYKSFIIVSILFLAISIAFIARALSTQNRSHELPIVAIANYGPHSSLNAALAGIKQELANQGFIEDQNIKYVIADVGFDTSLIPQVIANLKNQQPRVMVVLSTPVAQYAKHAIKDIPLIFTAVTDPVALGLLKDPLKPETNLSGSSDQQDLRIVLQFAKTLMPQAKRVGLIYGTAESNDQALLQMMQQAAAAEHMQLVSIAVEQGRDVPLRVQAFKDRVDLIYVGVSGVVQPALPAIAAAADKMGIPVFNADEAAVKQGMVLASFGVDYTMVGANAGKLVAQVLDGVAINSLSPIYPSARDHHGYINRAKAAELGINIPEGLANVENY